MAIPISTDRYRSQNLYRQSCECGRELASARIRCGYRKIRVLLNGEGWNVGKKVVYRPYREEGLGLRRRPKSRRLASAQSCQKPRAEAPNYLWSLDFVADEKAGGRLFWR